MLIIRILQTETYHQVHASHDCTHEYYTYIVLIEKFTFMGAIVTSYYFYIHKELSIKKTLDSVNFGTLAVYWITRVYSGTSK